MAGQIKNASGGKPEAGTVGVRRQSNTTFLHSTTSVDVGGNVGAADVADRAGCLTAVRPEGAPDLVGTDMGVLAEAWGNYVAGFTRWLSFVTLTFDPDKFNHNITRAEAEYKWRRLVQVLNTDLYGQHYVRMVGHCYFDYAVAYEPHKSNQLHMHVLIGQRINYRKALDYWQHVNGRIWIKKVTDQLGASRYLCKYVTKSADVMVYRHTSNKAPSFKPEWYQGL